MNQSSEAPPFPARSRRLLALAAALGLTLAASQAQSQAPTVSSDPAAVSWGPGRKDVFARGVQNGLFHMAYEGGWKQPENLGGGLIGGPGVCSWGPGRLDVFVRGDNNGLHQKTFDNGWGDWVALSAANQLSSDPAAVAWSQDRVDVFARGAQNGLWHMWWDRQGGWGGPENLGGGLIDAPTVFSPGPGKLEVFVRGESNILWRKAYDNGWKEWEQVVPTPVSANEATLIATLTMNPVTSPLPIQDPSTQITVAVTRNYRDWSPVTGYTPGQGLGLGLRDLTNELPDLMYQVIDSDLARANTNLDRAALLEGLKSFNVEVAGLLTPLMADLGHSIAKRDPYTWTRDERNYMEFLVALTNDQRQKAAAIGEAGFHAWEAQEAAKVNGTVAQLFYTEKEPPPEYLAMVRGGYAVSPEFAPDFTKIAAASAGLVAAGVGGAVAGAGLSVTVAGAIWPTVQALGIIASKTGGEVALGASSAAVGGAVAVVALMIEGGVLKAIALAKYMEYVKSMDGALQAAKVPMDIEGVRASLNTEEGVKGMYLRLVAQAATTK